MKLGEIIQRVQSLYSKGVESDDSRLTPRHIYNKLLTVRSKLLNQASNKRQFISRWNFQTLPCVELIKAPVHECPCLPPVGCEIYRTKFQLPEPLSNLNNHIISSVTTIDGKTVFSEIGWIEKKYKSENKYTASKPDFFIRNKYLYVTQKKGASIIAITAIFEDPLVAEAYPSYCDDCQDGCTDCGSMLDKDFPIDNDMVDTMVEMTIQELVFVFGQMREDKQNNSADDTSVPQQSRSNSDGKNR